MTKTSKLNLRVRNWTLLPKRKRNGPNTIQKTRTMKRISNLLKSPKKPPKSPPKKNPQNLSNPVNPLSRKYPVPPRHRKRAAKKAKKRTTLQCGNGGKRRDKKKDDGTK